MEWNLQDPVETEKAMMYLVKTLYRKSDGKYDRAYLLLGLTRSVTSNNVSSFADNANAAFKEAITKILKKPDERSGSSDK